MRLQQKLHLVQCSVMVLLHARFHNGGLQFISTTVSGRTDLQFGDAAGGPEEGVTGEGDDAVEDEERS